MVMNVESRRSPDSFARRRWLVHWALIIGLVATVLSAIELSKRYLGFSGVTDHSIIGSLVALLVIIHLFQRRQTVRKLVRRLLGGAHFLGVRRRLAVSDTILLLLVLNVMVSGSADWITGRTIRFELGTHLSNLKWHALSAIVLFVYVIVHAVRRRKRFKNSHVR